ncbi:MAG: hypothetical protein DME91_07615 [Verrucomicrobia bacterium]|nr:MAG: hypothetical protein DME91_07615 [Verrucomicrobiota bacterium]PYJ46333.1 MAG: hypothetical protein DME85_11325 [Verrucomicrobiota bacterium]PYK67120.1 MAG: hypothetical protein DME50_03635 [Verrucomicrobiota bacterium]
MKRIMFLICIGSLALALTAWGAQGKPTTRSARTNGGHAVSARAGGHVAAARAPRSIGSRAGAHAFARASVPRSTRMAAPRMRAARVPERASPTRAFTRNGRALSHERAIARANAMRSGRMEATRARDARLGQAANVRAAAGRNLAVNRQRNLTFARNVLANRAGNTRIVNYWRNDRFRGANYAAFYNYDRVWHDGGWWVSNYPNIAYFYPLGGWWYWDAGYWYPAWGYDPYAYYPYDGPIYGYGDVTPDRIIVNVQVALQRDGYYAGSIDGSLGPQTRAALAAFQADHGLAVTSAVDRPTIRALGLT